MSTYIVLLISTSPSIAFIGVIALCVFVLSFVKIELCVAIMLAAMLLSPEVRLGTVGSGLMGTRDVVVRVEDLLIPLLGFLWVAHAAIHRNQNLWAPSPINTPILIIIAFNLLISTRAVLLGAPAAKTFFINMKYIEFYAIFFFASAYFDSRGKIKMAMVIMFLTALTVMLYAIPMIPKTELLTVHRLSAPFEGKPEPGTLGGYLSMVMAILFGFFYYQAKNIEQKFLLILCIGVCALLVLYTLSRTSYGSLVAVLLMVAILARKPSLLLALLFVVLLSPFLLPERVADRLMGTIYSGDTWGLEQGALDRLNVWRKTRFLWKSNPILGKGIGTTDMMDSEYPRILLETGLVGFGLFLWLQIRIFLMSYRFFRSTRDSLSKALSLGYICGHMGILVHCLGAVTFSIVRIMEPFWLFTGILVGLQGMEIVEEEDPSFEEFQAQPTYK